MAGVARLTAPRPAAQLAKSHALCVAGDVFGHLAQQGRRGEGDTHGSLLPWLLPHVRVWDDDSWARGDNDAAVLKADGARSRAPSQS